MHGRRESVAPDYPYEPDQAKRANHPQRRGQQSHQPIRAWREHLGLTQTEVARRLGISQSAYAQQEAKEPVRKATREKIAQALGIAPAQLAV
jgi:DNA-binding XRE family transcriptional regulator